MAFQLDDCTHDTCRACLLNKPIEEGNYYTSKIRGGWFCNECAKKFICQACIKTPRNRKGRRAGKDVCINCSIVYIRKHVEEKMSAN